MSPPYPKYTGYEPCATTDAEVFFPIRGAKGGIHPNKVKAICLRGCDPVIREACAEWAIHHEREGVWGGLSAPERRAIRKRRGIVIDTVAAVGRLTTGGEPP